MKKCLIIISVLLMTMPIGAIAGGKPTGDKEKKKLTLFTYPDRKSLLRERDSLVEANAYLKMELDSLYRIYSDLQVYEELAEADSINAGMMDFESPGKSCADTISEADRDSLLSLWYKQRNMVLMDIEPSSLDSAEITSNIPDSVYINRLQKLNPYISIPYNRIIRNHIVYYTERMPEKMERILGLSSYYIPIFEEIFDQYDMPLELTAMAVIESALNAKAVSRARAKGMWQFMYSTARRYGLTINSYVDERFDPVASAHAAARYLRDSYLIFGDWTLAIASYNCGAGNVNKAIRRSGNSKDFWEIYPYLPRETRGYVPSFFAALYAMKYYKEHNLTPEYIPMPPHTDTIKVHKMLHFEQIAHFTGASIEELRTHNPQYLHDIIPGTEKEYILQLPYQYTNSFIDHEQEIYAWKDSVYFSPAALKKIQQGVSSDATRIVHKVRRGETLSHIALRYGVSVRNIQRWNGIGTRIREGQRLAIYTNGRGPAVKSSSSQGRTPSTTVSNGYVMYTVKSGDNLWDISRKFDGVTMNDLLKLNGLSKNSKIYPGKKIKIKKAQ
ncbi:MAG TPA: LysM peptidoglycan-binding domain-containing protein [Candidatus Coprenecus stercoravium]|uniref:LysM peptidoglycan-binding domain-containing protein n=1 Tax=Candidatus Coprenecus stercoravium TaxID=2840735 RepID=A0A9D2GMZ9_9BACT|nr:LysM peptidoglycan-binding domain-containing protein [Candidatus Coprenecus stercoravium]